MTKHRKDTDDVGSIIVLMVCMLFTIGTVKDDGVPPRQLLGGEFAVCSYITMQQEAVQIVTLNPCALGVRRKLQQNGSLRQREWAAECTERGDEIMKSLDASRFT